MLLLPPLVLVAEVIARCVSRGNMAGWIVFAAVFLVLAKGQTRRQALFGFAACVVVVFAFMGPEHRATITTRFTSISQRQSNVTDSAQSRIDFSAQALKMVLDYPLGSGGEAAFRSDRGMEYLAEIGETRFRSCHNGYLDIASSWGTHGLLIYLGTLFAVWTKVTAAARHLHGQLPQMAFVCNCLSAMLALQLFCCYFGSFSG